MPLLAAVWLPTGVLLGILSAAITGNWFEIPNALGVILLLTSFGGLALLGYVMIADSRAPAPGSV